MYALTDGTLKNKNKNELIAVVIYNACDMMVLYSCLKIKEKGRDKNSRVVGDQLL